MARHHMTIDGPVPFTPEEEAEWDAMEAAAIEKANADKVAQRKQAILSDLATLDTKSIRALCEQDTARLAALEVQKEALRTELRSLT